MKTLHRDTLPNLELLIELVQHSNRKLTVSEAGGIIYETVKHTVVENKEIYDVPEEASYRLAASLISSMFMTLATLGLSESCVRDLCKSLGVPYDEEDTQDKESEGVDA